MRYTARDALSLERLEQDANGDFIYRFTRPWSDGTTGIKLSPWELLEKLAALVPVPRAHLVRYGGCLAPHSKLRAAIIPTRRQQGADSDETKTGTPYWNWARLLGRVFDLDMATCPLCRHQPRVGDDPHPAPSQAGVRSSATAWAEGSAPTRCADTVAPSPATFPPPIAPARYRQEIFAFDDAHASVGS